MISLGIERKTTRRRTLPLVGFGAALGASSSSSDSELESESGFLTGLAGALPFDFF